MGTFLEPRVPHAAIRTEDSLFQIRLGVHYSDYDDGERYVRVEHERMGVSYGNTFRYKL